MFRIMKNITGYAIFPIGHPVMCLSHGLRPKILLVQDNFLAFFGSSWFTWISLFEYR